jgi:hypothetical protein
MEGAGVTVECDAAPPHAASARTISAAINSPFLVAAIRAPTAARAAGRPCGG